MAEAVRGIRPETRALHALIEACIERAEAQDTPSDTLLFLGNRPTAFPARVVQDPVLEPVDKLVWMTIHLQGTDVGASCAFPSYDYIRKTANIASKSTVARAIAVLRAARWLTRCARLRAHSGRFRGNVFALHDDPLPLADAIHLDSGYMSFVNAAQSNGHARVRVIARGVLESIDEDIRAGRDVRAVEDPRVGRIEAAQALRGETPRRCFAFSAKVMAELRGPISGKNGVSDQVRKSNPVADRVRNLVHQKSNPGSCSSSYINTTTTTTEFENRTDVPVTGEDGAPLIYPKRLSPNQRALADRYLSGVAAHQRQRLLDELEGRLSSEQKGMTPLYDPMRFLFSLCKAMKNGEFKENLGIRVGEERSARERTRANCQPPPVRSRDAGLQSIRSRLAAGQGALAEMRKALGLPSRPAQPVNPDEPE